MTAAHCLDVTAHLEVVATATLCGQGSHTRLQIASSERHPRRGGRHVDLAVLTLNGPPVDPDGGIRPLPSGGRPTAYGWGGFRRAGIRDCGVHVTPLRRLGGCPPPASAPSGRSEGLRGDAADWELCAAGFHDNTCTGDSGGPVVDRRHRIVAVTSRGAGCAPADVGVYVPLEPARGWLHRFGIRPE